MQFQKALRTFNYHGALSPSSRGLGYIFRVSVWQKCVRTHLMLWVVKQMSEDAKMQKDVVLSYQKSATVFINYLGALPTTYYAPIILVDAMLSCHRTRGCCIETAQEHICV